MSRRKRTTIRLAVAAGIVLAAAWFLTRGSASVRPTNPMAAPRPAVARRGPAVPPWSAPADVVTSEELRQSAVAASIQTIELSSGLTAVIYPTRLSFTVGDPIELMMELYRPDGSPLSDRATEVIAFRGDSELPPVKAGFSEKLYETPGTYQAIIMPGELTTESGVLSLLVNLRENDDPDHPGETRGAVVNVVTGVPATLRGSPVGGWQTGRLIVGLRVETTQRGTAQVRAVLIDRAGARLGEATQAATINIPSGRIELGFDGVDPATDGLQLADVTLWFDGQQATYWDRPSPVVINRP